MLSRREHEKEGTPFSDKMVKSIEDVLRETYNKECVEKNKIIKVYGENYPTEILLIISVKEENQNKIPTTCSLSTDIKEKKSNNPLEDLIDNAGILLDMVFSMSEEEMIEEYSDIWQETESSSGSFYYKITRENIELTLEANKILSKARD